MFTILLHSSKTMRQPTSTAHTSQSPALLSKSRELAQYMKSLPLKDIEQTMKLSEPMAEKTAVLWHDWTDEPSRQTPAIDAFLGDIYSGLQVHSFTGADRTYANEHLSILSGLYGVLRALDGIYPYRLEMGYRLPDEPYHNLYHFWGDSIAASLPTGTTILNLSAAEYTKTLLSHLKNREIITPKFLTIHPKSGEPKFVTVHVKIARGAFAHWVIQHRIETSDQLSAFNDLGYRYDAALSTPAEPVFICQTFQGLGLSVRLS